MIFRSDMEHLNYSRQLAKQCSAMLASGDGTDGQRAFVSRLVDLHGISIKFILPDGGRLNDDRELRALDESIPLHLPYPCICLEYRSTDNGRAANQPIGFVNGVAQYEQGDYVSAPRRIVYAEERPDYIIVTIAFWTRHDGEWRAMPECAIPGTYYLDRSMLFNGRPAIKAVFAQKMPRAAIADYMDELGALLCFLNILQCSNVHIERSEPKKAGKKVKSALPFDTYHVLTIDMPNKASDGTETGGNGGAGGHRSPREHLRRGHIRRLADGRRIWVNATVVCAGRGAGVVTKDYAMRHVA